MSGTHRNVVIGVTLLTLLAFISVFTCIGIWLVGVIAPPDPRFSIGSRAELVTFSDYITTGRVLVGFAFGIVATGAAWFLADRLID